MIKKTILTVFAVLALMGTATFPSFAAKEADSVENSKKVNILDNLNVYDIYTSSIYLNMKEKDIILNLNSDNTFDVLPLGEWFLKNNLYALSNYKNADDLLLTTWEQKETTIFSKDQLKSWYSNIEIGDIVQIYSLNPDDQSVLFDVEEVFAVNENGNFITQRMQIQNPDFFN